MAYHDGKSYSSPSRGIDLSFGAVGNLVEKFTALDTYIEYHSRADVDNVKSRLPWAVSGKRCEMGYYHVETTSNSRLLVEGFWCQIRIDFCTPLGYSTVY